MGEWVHGLCGCCGSPIKAIIASFCPCVTMGFIGKDMGMEFCTFCFCGNPVTLRAIVRSRDNISGTACTDCFFGCCCWCCSLVQTQDQVLKGPGKMPGQMHMT
eukprot:Platyproteum_vivax@DN5578_c0_g1_i4.p2